MASQGKEGYGVSEQRIDCEFKVVLIGDFEVGKCQILARCERKESKTGTTVTVKYETHTLHIEKKNVKAHIWCIIRQEQNNVDSNADYKDADGVILVYDITNLKSFDCTTLCLEELHRHAKKRQAIILIGNKSDSENDREVLRKEARGFAEKNDLIFWEISALEGTNFDNALKDLLTKLVNINGNNSTNSNNTNTNSNNTNTSTSTTTITHTNTIGNITYTIGNDNTFNNNRNLHLGSNLNLGSNWNLGDVHGDLNILSCFSSSTAAPPIHNCFRTQLKFSSPQSLSMGDPYRYRPHGVFTAMGHCWVLEDEFSYPINPNLRNSAQVHNTMRAKWDWLLCEQEMFYDEMVGYELPVPRRLASQMPRDTIDELRKALCRIRKENNQMKIRLNRYRTQVEIQESMECKLYEHARYMQSLLVADIYQSDVEMSDEE